MDEWKKLDEQHYLKKSFLQSRNVKHIIDADYAQATSICKF